MYRCKQQAGCYDDHIDAFKDERIVLRTRPHVAWLLSRLPMLAVVSIGNGVVATIVACATAALLADTGEGAKTGFKTGVHLATLMAWILAVPAVYLIVLLSVWLTTHYVITDRRVFAVEGTIGGRIRRQCSSIPLPEITKVSHTQKPFDALFGSGDLIITSGKTELRLQRLPQVEKAKAALLQAKDQPPT